MRQSGLAEQKFVSGKSLLSFFLEIRSETKQIEIKILRRLTAYSGLIKSLHRAMAGRMRLI